MRPLDRALLGILAPIWALALLLSLLSLDRNAVVSPLRVHGAASAEALPVVSSFPPWTLQSEGASPPVRVGDALAEVGGVDVRGASAVRVVSLAWYAMDAQGRLPVRIEREGARVDTELRIPATIPKWPVLVMSLVYGGLALFSLLRFPTLRVVQVAFPCTMAAAIWMGSHFGETPQELFAAFSLRAAALVFLWPLNVRVVRHLPDGDDRTVAWARGWPALLGAVGVLLVDATLFDRLPANLHDGGQKLLTVVGAALVLGIGALKYRAANRVGRRRFKWLLLGILVGSTPSAAVAFASAFRPELGQYFLPSQLAQIAIPVSLLVAVVRHQLFDIDRLLNLAAVVAGGALVVGAAAVSAGPTLQRSLVEGAGATPTTAALVLGAGALAIAVPCAIALRRRLDAWVLRERRARARAVQALLPEISRAAKLPEIGDLLTARLPEIWGARGAALWIELEGKLRPVARLGRDGAGWTEGDGALQRQLLEHGVCSGEELGVDSLRGSLLAPIVAASGPERVAGVLLLGALRSGDAHEASDRALLALLAERTAGALAVLEGRGLLRDARNMARVLAGQRDRAERASAAKTRMLAAASHDARQPMQALRLFLDTLDSRIEDAELAGVLENARVAAIATQQRFESLLDQTRLDSGALSLQVQPVELAALFRELEIFLSPLARAKQLEFSLAAESEELRVLSDPALLRSILQNLLGNAIRYTKRGRVSLRAHRDGGRVRVEVRDTGPGIDEAAQRRIFGEWERGEQLETGEGSGLGLSIVARLVDELGHELTLDSRAGEGAVFTLTLEAASGAVAESTRTHGDRIAGSLLWLIEDDPQVRASLVQLFEDWGAEVRAAEGSAALLREPRDRRPDALLADHGLVGETGFDAIAAVQRALGPLPCALLSADGELSAPAKERGLPFVRKPAAPVQLRALLASLLAERGSGG